MLTSVNTCIVDGICGSLMSTRNIDGDRRAGHTTKRRRDQPEAGESKPGKRAARSEVGQSGGAGSNAQRRAQVKAIYQSYVLLTSEDSKLKADAAFKLLVDACGGRIASVTMVADACHVHPFGAETGPVSSNPRRCMS